MLFPVQLVTQNMKDDYGNHYIKSPQSSPDQSALLSSERPQRPKLQKRTSSSASIRSWSSKSSFGRSMTNIWDSMPTYNTNMRDPAFFVRRDGGSHSSSAVGSPAHSRATSTMDVPQLHAVRESA